MKIIQQKLKRPPSKIKTTSPQSVECVLHSLVQLFNAQSYLELTQIMNTTLTNKHQPLEHKEDNKCITLVREGLKEIAQHCKVRLQYKNKSLYFLNPEKMLIHFWSQITLWKM